MRGSTSTKKTNVCPMTGKSGTCPMQSPSDSTTTNKEEEEGRIVSPKEQQEEIWNTVVQLNSEQEEEEEEERKWPSYDTVMSDVAFSDYSQVLECPLDVRPSTKNGKKLCPYGTAACVEMTIFENTPYTGLLRPGQTLDHGIIRLSSAIQPLGPSSKGKTSLWNKPLLLAAGKELSGAKLFPTVAIKFFRNNGIRSGNLLFAGRKVGQSEHDFFAHCVCTQLTEKVATTLKPIVKIFAAYSKNPLSLGVSDFCSYNVDGEQETNVQFPFAIALKPLLTFPHHDDDDVPFDSFLNDLVTIPKGTAIYDVYACPNPLAVEDASQLQRIGQIKTTSSMIPSGPTDSLFFRHQNKEEDFQYQPQWKREIKKHNINNKAGWKIFERHIATGTYQDFEKKINTTPSPPPSL